MTAIQQIKWSVIEALKETSDHWEDMEKDMADATIDQIEKVVMKYHFDCTEEMAREYITNAIADYPAINLGGEPSWKIELQKAADECPGEKILQIIVDTVGEYEHGTADVEDVFPGATLEAYAAVARDLIQTITSQI